MGPSDDIGGGLDDTEHTALRALVVAEQDRTAAQLAALVRTFDELVAAADLEPPDDEHDPDGTTAYERAQVASIAEVTRTRLAEIDRAIDKIDDEDYGRCEKCGQPIGLERLQAMPGTTRCVGCAAAGPPGSTG